MSDTTTTTTVKGKTLGFAKYNWKETHRMLTVKLVLVFWEAISLAYLITMYVFDRTKLATFLTYWSYIAETVVLGVILLIQLVRNFTCKGSFRGKKPAPFYVTLTVKDKNIDVNGREWFKIVPYFDPNHPEVRVVQILTCIQVSLIGWIVGTSIMVLLGSVYISSAAYKVVGAVIQTDPSGGVSNFVIHTMPVLMAIVLLIAYQEEITEFMAFSCPIVLFTFGNLWSANTTETVVRLVGDILFYWVPLLPPLIWSAFNTAGDTYGLPSTPRAFFVLLAVSIFAPCMYVAIWARYRLWTIEDIINDKSKS